MNATNRGIGAEGNYNEDIYIIFEEHLFYRTLQVAACYVWKLQIDIRKSQ